MPPHYVVGVGCGGMLGRDGALSSSRSMVSLAPRHSANTSARTRVNLPMQTCKATVQLGEARNGPERSIATRLEAFSTDKTVTQKKENPALHRKLATISRREEDMMLTGGGRAKQARKAVLKDPSGRKHKIASGRVKRRKGSNPNKPKGLGQSPREVEDAKVLSARIKRKAEQAMKRDRAASFTPLAPAPKKARKRDPNCGKAKPRNTGKRSKKEQLKPQSAGFALQRN